MMEPTICSKDERRSQFKGFDSLEKKRSDLIQACYHDHILAWKSELNKLCREAESDHGKALAVLQADLEAEKKARRGFQEIVAELRVAKEAMEKSRYVLVLIDADADFYLFDKKFLSRRISGGLEAADAFEKITREYLKTLGASISDPEKVHIKVKAYANLEGQSRFCLTSRLVNSLDDVSQFWIGFTRRFPTFEFMDIGSGREEVDHRLRKVLSLNIDNIQCKHVILACGHDSGYAGALREYSNTTNGARISLLETEKMRHEITTLGFKSTTMFRSLFQNDYISAPALPRPELYSKKLAGPVLQQTGSGVGGLAPVTEERLVANVARLGPVLFDSTGKRVDRPLSVDENLLKAMRKHDFCHWHYLRADCVKPCVRRHDYRRPVSDKEFDAIWYLSRFGKCNKMRRMGGNCTDDKCIFGH
ncbi:hypothetical protein GLAREA_06643 [Glarea lozoyensis ATCC 20868]|uniref:DUF7923 domain-containing protein n=1 Tax=Glarea lozoyensis (strain ATCC 20868 / MF5171) TaxID=1116229 RepID=S3D758_GLAL2|nr:uncharacterized protein GLAREA_06643 [Glarea lozoyensis ATCC 20868]EPE33630.1 hypothetical protein GLAREA_06643 [Glarea lozoyensis ATCC 20868]